MHADHAAPAGPPQGETVDLLIIGGGVNGCGIARDAAGRGFSVLLAEMGDLGSATSSASTKLFHGGLRYLEYFELSLVREALEERETLLRAMPHIAWPMRFVLPWRPDMRFDADTPASKLISTVLPRLKGRRPAWMVRLGLFLYDHLGGRKILPGTRAVDLSADPAGAPLAPGFARAWEYSDAWVQDSRLVVLNARDAAARGAELLLRTKVVAAARAPDHWAVTLEDAETGARQVRRARMLVNASGPWAAELGRGALDAGSRDNVRLVRGSHIVVPRMYDHDRCYFLQGPDARIIFAIPYEQDFTLIGTTDAEHGAADDRPVCSEAERDYLLAFANRYFRRQLTADDVVWSYSGVRPLYDDGASSATAATRDYVLRVDADRGAPALHVFGGKITTYRRLAESALQKISAALGRETRPWTAGAPLPGGDFPVDGAPALVSALRRAHPWLADRDALRLVRAYGTEAAEMLAGAASAADAGRDFGAGLTEREAVWLMDREWARTAEDVVWRRTRLGLRMTADQIAALDAFMAARRAD